VGSGSGLKRVAKIAARGCGIPLHTVAGLVGSGARVSGYTGLGKEGIRTRGCRGFQRGAQQDFSRGVSNAPGRAPWGVAAHAACSPPPARSSRPRRPGLFHSAPRLARPWRAVSSDSGQWNGRRAPAILPLARLLLLFLTLPLPLHLSLPPPLFPPSVISKCQPYHLNLSFPTFRRQIHPPPLPALP
jgi:hypothetical protein